MSCVTAAGCSSTSFPTSRRYLPRSEVSAELKEAVRRCDGATPRAGCLDGPVQLSHEPRRDVDQARQGFYEVAGGLVGSCAWSSAKLPGVEGLESKP
jgi:hypothetical protein